MNRLMKEKGSGILFMLLCVAGSVVFNSCKKDNGNPGGDGNTGKYNKVGGRYIYYEWATEGILKFDLTTATVSTLKQDNVSRNGWDISTDGAQYIQAEDKQGGFYDTEIFTLTNIANSNVIAQFEKESGYANASFPKLSRNAQLIATSPTLDNGLMVMNLQGKLLHHIKKFQNQDIDRGNVNWMPDNSVVFSIGKKICRTNPEFTQASVIKELPFDEWKDLSVSNDGSKMAFAANNHIWMMNADGSNMVQVTNSNQVEVIPEFSPDGNWLILGTDYRATGPFGHIWNLVIIPADGKQYNTNEGADNNVIPLIRKGEDRPEACSGTVLWR